MNVQGQLVGSSLDPDSILERVTREVSEAIGDCCVISLLDESGQRLVTRSVHHTDPQRAESFRGGLTRSFRSDEGFFAEPFATGRPLLLQPYESGRGDRLHTAEGHQHWIDSCGSRGAILAPLAGAGATFGMLVLFRDVTAEPYDETDVALCVELAGRSAQALHNALLMEQVICADTARVAARERLSRAERMEGLGLLAGGVAHDFNNLLGVISLSAQLAQRGVPSAGETADSLSMILDATDRAAGLTRQLLLFSRRQPGTPTTLDLRTVLGDLEQLLSRSIGDQVRLELRLGLGPLLVRADQTRLEQVLLNLAVNARDAMPDGGVLRITAAWMQDPYSSGPTGRQTTGSVRIAFTDTGTGMSEEVQKRAFEPFFTTKAVGVGTGLGLATVHGIVTELGGTLRIDSSPGAGTTISVELPAVDRSEPPLEAPPKGDWRI